MSEKIQLMIMIFILCAGKTSGQKQKATTPLSKLNYSIQVENSRADHMSIIQLATESTHTPELRVKGRWTDHLGITHQEFQQYHNGVIIEGSVQKIHSKRNSKYLITGILVGDQNLPSGPIISNEQADKIAHTSTGSIKERYFDLENETKLVYYFHQGHNKVYLCYKVDQYISNPISRSSIYVDAISGNIIETIEQIHSTDADLTGDAYYEGNVPIPGHHNDNNYVLSSQVENIHTYSLQNSTDYNNAKEVTSTDDHIDEDPIAVQAHYGAFKTHQFYKEKFNRSSYDNLGSPLNSYVHYGSNYANAFWDGYKMTYGDGNGTSIGPLVSIDIVGHEISHGVVQYSADLLYKYEAGALNESFADIFGEAIEHYTRGHNDWLIGKEIFTNGGAVRSMKDPNSLNDPDTHWGQFWYAGGADHGGVHTNSGVQNFWYYLISEGGSGINDHGQSYSIEALGIEKSTEIAYRNLTTYLHTYSNYYDARTGSIQAAIDLYGEDSQEVISVTNAWYAVGVGPAYRAETCYSGTLNLEIHFDSYPAETSWEIVDTHQTIIASGGPYFDHQAGDVVMESISINPGAYEVIFHDSYGDGMCCGYGDGYYSITIGETLIKKGSYFTDKDITKLCIENLLPEQDTIPPTLPGEIMVINKTHERLDIRWNASFDENQLEGYNVYLDGVLFKTTVDTSTSMHGLTPSTTYLVGVEAYDTSGNISGLSTISVSTEDLPDLPPSVVEPEVSSITSTTANVNWNPSQDNGYIVEYQVYLNGTLMFTTTTTEVSFEQLQAETEYEVIVYAKDNSDQLSNPGYVRFTTHPDGDTTPPTVPENLMATNIQYDKATISWHESYDESGVLNYDIEFNGINIATLPLTQFTLQGLAESTEYTIRIRARDNNGNVSDYASLNFTTSPAPDHTPPTSPGPVEVIELSANGASFIWNSSTDDNEVSGYDVFLDNNWVGFIQDTTFTLYELEPSTLYEFSVIARDASDNESPAGTISFSTLSDQDIEEVTILGSHFETGWEGWNDGGVDAYRYAGSYTPEGQYCIRLRDNSGSKSSMTTDALDISGFNLISISFLYIPHSMETNEDFFVEYYDGNQWNIVSRYISGSDFRNNNLYEASVLISTLEYQFSEEALFRIRCDASSNADKIYIDKVIIIGNPSDKEISGSAMIQINVINALDLDQHETENFELSIYPNPVTDYLNLQYEEAIDAFRIYTLDGKLIMSKNEFEPNGINVSSLEPGLYILEINSMDEVLQEKFIKN